MDIIIDKLEGFSIVGVTRTVHLKDDLHKKEIGEFWEQTMADSAFLAFIEKSPAKETLFGVSHNYDEATMTYDYTIGVKGIDIATIDGETVVEIPAIDYAIFDKKGPCPESVHSLFSFIMGDWLPNSDYVHADAPEVEVYPDGDIKSEDYVCHVWIPVVKKAE